MAYKHGVYINEDSTSIVAPVEVESAMPVFFVTAPVHLSENPYGVTNVPKLVFTYSEAVSAFGFSGKKEIWDKYTSCEVIQSMFSLYGVSPCVIVNVLDPGKHKEDVTGESVTLRGYSGIIEADGVLKDTVKIKNGGGYYILGKHYTVSFNDDGFAVINAVSDADDGISEDSVLEISYTRLKPEEADIFDIIGGFNDETGKNEGFELISEIFPRFRKIPCQIAAPGFSSSPAVAAVMETKTKNINGCFNAVALVDLPTIDEKGNHIKYSDIVKWKNDNNYTGANMIACYPETELDGYKYHLSAQLAGCIALTDYENDGVPYVSPSNHSLKINGLVYGDGEEFILTKEQADYLNGNGIVTAINFTNGWTAWGNRTAVYPSSSDVKDCFIPTRRMFNWLGNSIVTNYLAKVDYPLLRRTIETIVDSIGMWLNGLASRECILGGSIEFLDGENPTTDLIDGIVRFRVKFAPPSPMRDIEFTLEYDSSYLSDLF